MTNWIEKYQLGNKARGKLVKNSEGKVLLDKNGMPVYLPVAGTAKLTASPIDAGVIAATGVGPLVLRWAGANILGNIMASSINQLPEAIGSITGNISKFPISEDIKRVGGFNDFIQAKKYLKSGNLGKGAWNVATGIGGIYDSKRWTPNWKYDDILDKSLEYMNAVGDSFDAVKGLQELKASGGIIKAQEGMTTRAIPEIIVYGKKNYLQELDKQQQKYLADMAKYKQDSAQWVKANKAYQDSLSLYHNSYKDVERGKGYDYLRYFIGQKRSNYPYTLDSEKYLSLDELKKNKERILTKKEIENEINRYGKRDIEYIRSGYADKDWFLDPSIPENKRIALQRYRTNINYSPRDTYSLGLETYIKKYGSKPEYILRGAESQQLPLFKKPIKEPIEPMPPIGTNVKYDDTYENLRMRPLWATMAKQDTAAKIGTLNPLDPLYEKGFTYGEAQKFPKEIREQYKLDYPIYQEGGIIKAQKGVKVSEDRRNWLQRTNDKIQTAYNKNKPQLLKDFPLLDLPGMMVEYVTGHSKDPDAGLAMVNPVGKIGKAIKVHQAAGKFKAKEKGINFVKNWIEHPESQKRINEITNLSDVEVLNQALQNGVRSNPGVPPEEIRQYIEDKAFLMGINERLKKDLGVLGPELFSTKNLNRGYLVPQSRILNKGSNASSGTVGLSWKKGNFWIARETPRKAITSNVVHEATHNLTGNRDNIKIKELTDEAFGGELVLEKLRQANPQHVNDINYFSDPTEVYARVMELRNQFKLKPGQIVDKKLGEKIFTKGALNKTPVDNKFFILMQIGRQDLPKKGGAWFTDLFNKLPVTVPVGIVGSSMYMNNQNKDKE